MQNQSVDYRPCTVAVSSFTPGAEVAVAIAGASWWPYAGLIDSQSQLDLLITGVPLGLNNLNVTPGNLEFIFSGNVDDSETKVVAGARRAGVNVGVAGPVIPPTITLKLYVHCAGDQFSVGLRQEWPGLAGFAFNGVLYSLNANPIEITWPI